MKSTVRLLVSMSALFCHLFCILPGVSAQVPSLLQAPSAMLMKADSQHSAGKIYYLDGHVDVLYGGMRLNADHATYDEETGEIFAYGNVHYSRVLLQEDIWAVEAHYNLRSGTGSFF